MAEQRFKFVGGPRMAREANGPSISSALWESQRTQVEDLIKQDYEIKDVVTHLRAEDGFWLVSERQLRYRLKLWGFSKKKALLNPTPTSNASIMTANIPDAQVYDEYVSLEAPDRPSLKVKQLLNSEFPPRSSNRSIRRLLSTAARNDEPPRSPKDLAQIDLLAAFFSAISLHKEAFGLSLLVVLQTMPKAHEAGIEHLKARLTRLAKNATSSSDRAEVTRIMKLVASKYGIIEPIANDSTGCLLFSHVGRACYTDEGEMCKKALFAMRNPKWGTWGGLAELYANRKSTVPHHYAHLLQPWNEVIDEAVGAVEQYQINDSLAVVCGWIRNVLAEPDHDAIWAHETNALWEDAPDPDARAETESVLLFCELWNRWQLRKGKAGSASAACESAFELLEEACGLNQAELLSALARLVLEDAVSGVKTDLTRRALSQALQIETTPGSRSIFNLLNAHVKPLYLKPHRLSNPDYNALRQESVRAFVEANMSISETLFYDSRFRLKEQMSGAPFVPLFMTNSPRSSCSTELRSFKDVQLRQWVKRMSKSSSLRFSQISEMSIATFSSGERWLKQNAAESGSWLQLDSAPRRTSISAPKLLGSESLVEKAIDPVFDGNSDTDWKAAAVKDLYMEIADVMDMYMDTKMML